MVKYLTVHCYTFYTKKHCTKVVLKKILYSTNMQLEKLLLWELEVNISNTFSMVTATAKVLSTWFNFNLRAQLGDNLSIRQ